MTVLLVALGGAAGACTRFVTDRRMQGWHDSVFPWGTFAVNVVGSLILGFLAGFTMTGGISPNVQAVLGVGFCGALTTYSTFGYETVRLFADGARLYAVLNVVGTVVAGLVAGVAGIALGVAAAS